MFILIRVTTCAAVIVLTACTSSAPRQQASAVSQVCAESTASTGAAEDACAEDATLSVRERYHRSAPAIRAMTRLPGR